MPPRKVSQSPSAVRDDPPKKKAKHSHSPSTSMVANAAEGTTLDSCLTADEKNFLVKQLAQLKKGLSDNAASPPPDVSSSTWLNTLLPTVATITEKVLKAAAEQYTLAEAARATTAEDEEQPDSAPANPAGTPQQFAQENDYLVDQLRQLQWAPFTYQRLLELLASPVTTCRCVRTSPVGKSTWRGDVLQAALRRCILVNYPFTGDTERSA